MKNKFTQTQLILLILLFIAFSCQKESAEFESISKIPEATAKYSKELVVRDLTQKSTVLLLISSNDEESLDQFLRINDFVLETVNLDQNIEYNDMFKSSSEIVSKSNYNDNEFANDNDFESTIFIEVIAGNLQEDVDYYFISLRATNLKSSMYNYYDTPRVQFITSNNFVGVVHSGYGNDFQYYWSTKNNFFSKWVNWPALHLWPFSYGPNIYSAYLNTGSYYRRAVVVHQTWADYNSNIRNYRFADKPSEFYGRTCSFIGNYDSWSCYVGTPPAGTQAFMYPNNTGAFYYSPVSGNQCPLPGSWFDGVNCYYANIPSGTKGFIYDNKWYVFPDLLPVY